MMHFPYHSLFILFLLSCSLMMWLIHKDELLGKKRHQWYALLIPFWIPIGIAVWDN